MDFFEIFGDYDFVLKDFIQHFLPLLSLSRLCGLCPEAVDEFLKMPDFFLLFFVFFYEGFKLYFPHFFVVAEIPGVSVKVAVEKLVDFVNRVVEEVAVVAYEKETTRKIAKEFFEPFPGLDVKIVGRLVQKEDVGIDHEGFCKGDSHLPAAGKFLAFFF